MWKAIWRAGCQLSSVFLELTLCKGNSPPSLRMFVWGFEGHPITQSSHYEEIEWFGALGKKVNFDILIHRRKLTLKQNLKGMNFIITVFYHLRKGEKNLICWKIFPFLPPVAFSSYTKFLKKSRPNRLLFKLLVTLPQLTCFQISFQHITNQQKFTGSSYWQGALYLVPGEVLS